MIGRPSAVNPYTMPEDRFSLYYAVFTPKQNITQTIVNDMTKIVQLFNNHITSQVKSGFGVVNLYLSN